MQLIAFLILSFIGFFISLSISANFDGGNETAAIVMSICILIGVIVGFSTLILWNLSDINNALNNKDQNKIKNAE
ncbi:hypothetical protein Curi_c05870 [Gottschalkia acidurici 9a]|uniref:Uncharacterized protein n=1 Tax=Gottschalkia acidurici (strain ATCC 7906 / DSM 604 / BCRC 14475 / CIP 104303 / KCTC 5404 / NCIMB 10678 / 9a) TaxID=1128398 RepID=K0AZ41_GOTA9|nr:hypothetical protein [Gottschalkia acidurici]AFS77661.1 hypothetical protein Curi_c05870 [Gottschalkia acidurici 9a]